MKKILVLLFLTSAASSFAQSPLTSTNFSYHLIDRYEITNGHLSEDLFTGIKPFRRDAVAEFGKRIVLKSEADSFNQSFIAYDNVLYSKKEESSKRDHIFGSFYKMRSTLCGNNSNDFGLMVNPVLGFSSGLGSDSLGTYRNSRGFEIRGHIGNKVGFYTYALENQVRYPEYLRNKQEETEIVTGATLAKPFGTESRDFFNVRGYITFSPIEQIMVQFGQDKNFIGNGYRSLILSDIATPNPFVKINTKVWKINYMNLYSQHTDFRGYQEKAPTLRKYSALHHLSFNVGDNLTLGLFENVIFDRQDSLESGNYEFHYLNPMIFYRAVEHGLNSSDNVVLGADWKWNFLNRFSFYGQVVFDEFIKDEFFSASSSWVNKWGYQAGIKYINVAGINNLDFQTEINQLRPHVYQHEFKSQNWIHYDQSLAHPLGSNFREIIGILKYQPIERLNLAFMYSMSKQGIDTNNTSINYGGDVTRATFDLLNKRDVHLFQGIENSVSAISFDASYMLWHNLFIDAGVFIRNQSNSILISDSKTTIFRFGLRLNTAALDLRQY
jgi:hypothetical protein